MRHVVRLELIAILLLAICGSSRLAHADSETVAGCANCNGYTFQASLTPAGSGNYTLSYTLNNTNTSTTQNAYAFGWSLTMFGSGSTITNANSLSVTESGPGAPFTNFASDYTLQDGKSNNGSNGNCNSSVGGAICIAPTTTLNSSFPVIAPGQSLTFAFSFSCVGCTPLSIWDFLSSGKCVSNTNSNCYAPSAYGTPIGSTSVPEPSVVTLLGSELALMVGLVAAFRQKRNRLLLKLANLFCLQPRLTS
jgi:hypothetical protein